MREKMGQMQVQIQEFVATLNRELATRQRTFEPDTRQELIPVVIVRSALRKSGRG
jgi:hypothetical protein